MPETPIVDRMLAEVTRFQQEVIDYPIPPIPTALSSERKTWAHTVLTEELTELMDSTTVEDQADAILDGIYFGLGRLVEMGIVPGPWFDEIQRANMSKVRGTLEKREGSAGFDAVKPEGWKGPDFSALIRLGMKELLLSQTLVDRYRASQKAAMAKVRPRIMIMGYARHGKDTACELLEEMYGLNFQSSSRFIAERIIMPSQFAKDQGYATADEAYEDRGNHRSTWYDMISAFNTPDKTSLGRALFAEFDIYCGIRSAEEFHALRNTDQFDVSIWIDASDRVPSEDSSSCTVAPWMADYVVPNNTTPEALRASLGALVDTLLVEHHNA
jgi:predicted HAD superfamily Cof-like phosphohydrolase